MRAFIVTLGLGLAALPAHMARTAGLKRVGPVYAGVGIWVMTTPAMARVPRVRAFVEQLVNEFRARQSHFTAPPVEPVQQDGRSGPTREAELPVPPAAHQGGTTERKRGPSAPQDASARRLKRQRG